jgi:hypothetical protein
MYPWEALKEESDERPGGAKLASMANQDDDKECRNVRRYSLGRAINSEAAASCWQNILI